MKKIITALLLSMGVLGTSPINAAEYDLQVEDYFTNGSMGCMMMRECTKDVKEVKSIKDVELYQGRGIDHSLISTEFNNLVELMDEVGVNVYIAPQYYFLIGTRGVYYTVGNNIFLNSEMVERSSSLMSVMRHEGWHTAQDCMAGTIKNSMIAIIVPEETVPPYFNAIANDTYKDNPGLDWEREAYWAGHSEGMTVKALEACATGAMWEVYPPTPLTKEYLVKEGYIKE